MSKPLLQIEGLNAFYGAAQILFQLSFDVHAGEVVALMGRNGAGKSTTMKAIMGLEAERTGKISFLGQGISDWPTHAIARLGLGFVPEDRRIFTELTVRENLEIGRQPPRRAPDGDALAPWTPERLYALFPNLAEMQDRPAARMSGGEQQMLTVARTLMGNPLLILLDEPSEGVAPVIVEQMAHAIQAMKAEGIAILLSEQNLHFAALVSDRAVVLEKGEARYTGGMADLMADEKIRRDYLSV